MPPSASSPASSACIIRRAAGTAAAPGGAGRLSLASGTELRPKGLGVVPPGDRLVVEMPGGGGMGPARERDPDAVRRDVRLGYVSREAALRDYGLPVED